MKAFVQLKAFKKANTIRSKRSINVMNGKPSIPKTKTLGGPKQERPFGSIKR
ncbi:hypothetical protein [Flavobacterium reichenbachii]|uniref:hypothetical protein n=1 Tax=Flavobacterium reichenbachii TaxID=362418 RepID=UPI0013F407D5|nr:hypothetical protein [Flavobacterium reichenbachii]